MNPNATIHPSAVIEGDVQIGDGTVVDPFVYIKGPVVIGKNNHIRSGSAIGTDGESSTLPSVGTVYIGDNNVISDLVTVQRSIGDRDTTIGNGCYIMAHCHIAHDCYIGDNVTIAAGAVLAGHTVVLDGATLGVGAVTHQKTTIGSYCMVGMNSAVNKDVPPFAMSFGNPLKFKGRNEFRINKMGLDPENLEQSELYQQSLAAFEASKGRK